jgi:RNA polymerase sigma-70 factor (ECF subfamily)
MNEASELARPRLLPRPIEEHETASQLDALRARDPQAWTALFEDHRDLVFRSALAQTGARETAEDITGQVFLEAIEGIGRYRDRGRPLSAWLLTIAKHRSLDAVRKRRRERAAALPIAGTDVPASDPALLALASLTVDQRQIIHLRFVEDLSIDEVARVTGRSAGAVKALQHRALHQLRSQLRPTQPQGQSHE